MDKVRWITCKGKDTKKETQKSMLDEMLERRYASLSFAELPAEPPKDWMEFENRIGKFENKLRDMLFGFTYNLETGKTLKREKSIESIVESLCDYDKYSENIQVITEHFNPFLLLKLILEQDAPFVICEDTYLLGFKRDRSGLSLPQKNTITIQVAAQVLWYLEKNKIPTIELMSDHLLDKQHPFFKLFSIDRFHNPRTIKNWISKVFPVPSKLRKGRPSLNEVPEDLFNSIMPVPGIFFEDGKVINILKLQFTIQCITRILKTLSWTMNQIENSEFILLYQRPLKYYLRCYVATWIKKTFEENGSVFTQ